MTGYSKMSNNTWLVGKFTYVEYLSSVIPNKKH